MEFSMGRVHFRGSCLGVTLCLGLLTSALAFAETPPVASEAGELKVTDPDVVQKAKDQLGVGFPDNYGDEQCIPVSKDDPCLPTGFVQAVERGEPYVTLWKAELLVEQGKALGADKLLLDIDKKHPNTPKTLWLIAKNAYFRAEKMPEDATEEKAAILERGFSFAERCVELAPKDINCLLHFGTLLGRVSTNRGIISSAANGDDVEDHWLRALETKEHYRFPSANTSLGAVNYGLGIFYRLVPDSWIMSLLFGVRGDIGKAVKHLQAAMKTKADEVELYTELVAASYCKAERDDDDAALKLGHDYVKQCQTKPATSVLRKLSQSHCGELRDNPGLGCGYSRDKQQETDAEKFKKKD